MQQELLKHNAVKHSKVCTILVDNIYIAVSLWGRVWNIDENNTRCLVGLYMTNFVSMILMDTFVANLSDKYFPLSKL